MSNYPIGKAVPPPSGGGGWGAPGAGAPGGWAPPQNAWGAPAGGWAPPTGAWAPPTGAWGSSGGSGYPPSQLGGYSPSQPGGYPPAQPGGYPPSQGGSYPPSQGGGYPQSQGGGYPPAQGGYPSASGSYMPAQGGVYPPSHSGDAASSHGTPGAAQSLDYNSAIQYLKSLNNQDQIPDEGKAAFVVLAGVDGAVDAFELQDILNKVFLSDFKFDGFGSDMTRSLVAMRDYDISGKLGFSDFRKLWTDLSWCKKALTQFDVTKTGAFNKSEFANALDALGLTVTPKTHKAMIMRYSDKEGNIRFDDFVLCYMRLKTMMKTYQGKDTQTSGWADFERDEFVQLAIYS